MAVGSHEAQVTLAKGRFRRVMGRIALTAAALVPVLMLGSSPSSGAAPVRVAGTANAVTVTRDTNGIPHIVASNFEGLGYGEAWAFAQDNFCTLAQDFVTVEGKRSRYFGPNGLSIDYSAGTVNSNLNSDLFWKMIAATHPVTLFEHAPPPVGPLPQIKQLYRGFVRGYNTFLSSGSLHDPTCAGQPWVRPIDLEDMYLRGIQISTEASSQQFVTREVNAVPPVLPAASGTARQTTRPAVPRGNRSAPNKSVPVKHPVRTGIRPVRTEALVTSGGATPSPTGLASLKREFGVNGNSTLGSNGIALGSADTVGHDGMVLANPHFPWQGTERFWMAQLTVPGQYDVMGGTLEGFPLIGIGFNQDLAWTHTVSTDERFTFYQLQLVPGHPTSYYVNGKATPMGRVSVRVDNGSGTVTHTFYTTIWGTVAVVHQASYSWSTTTAYAVDDSTINDTFRAANQYLRMGQSTSVSALLQVESKYLAIPTFNTIAADSTGHVLYADVGNTPNVPLSMIHSSCLPSGLPTLVYQASGLITLDGSRTACAWHNDPGTPVPGIFNASHLPHTIRTDYVENSNDSYWLANPSAPFPAFSPIIGNIDVPQGLRTRLGNQMIAQRLAGTDGFGPPGFTIPSLQKMWESDQSEEAQLVLPALVSACNADPRATASNGQVVDLRPACRALSGYNGTGTFGARGGWLFSEWYRFAPSNAWTVPFNPAAPLTTPSGLNTADPQVLSALADAVQNLRAHNIPIDAGYRPVQHYDAANGKRIPIPGCDTGCFNAIYSVSGSGGPLSPGAYGAVYDGSSLVMTTELTPTGPIAQGILTYSQSTDPTSPWASNMTKLYAQKRWVPLRFTPAELAADRGAKTIILRF